MTKPREAAIKSLGIVEEVEDHIPLYSLKDAKKAIDIALEEQQKLYKRTNTTRENVITAIHQAEQARWEWLTNKIANEECHEREDYGSGFDAGLSKAAEIIKEARNK